MTGRNRYTCEETFRRLDDFVDRELSDEEMVLVREHLETCAGCAREFDFEASLIRQVRSKLLQIDVPDELQSRVLGILAAESAHAPDGSLGDVS